MSDIRTLLRQAAPQPVAPLDLAAIHARAYRTPARRVVAWIAGLGAVIGVAVPVGNSLLVGAGHEGQDLRTRLTTPAPSIVERPDAGEVGGGSEAAAPVAARDEAPAPSTSTGPGTGPAAAPTTVPTADSPGPGYEVEYMPGGTHDPAPSCWVDNQGLGSGETRVCRFTATAAGGWNAYQQPLRTVGGSSPMARVTVTRDGRSMTYRAQWVDDPGWMAGSHWDACADGIIEPGDLVDVVITQSVGTSVETSATSFGAGAGAGWGCTDPGP